jgi:hypothetical protein
MPKRSLVAISRIRIDGGTQTRAGLRSDVVEEYAAVVAAGGDLPAAVVFDDGDELWMADGFHRHEAYRLAGKAEMPVEIRKGTKRDALLYAVGCNDTHGLRRSNEDKRQAVRMILADEEWSEKSDRWVAEQCHVSEHTVAAVRVESTAQTRSCHQKTGENDEKQDHDNDKRVGKDGKERPAKTSTKAKVLCERCQRVGVVKNCTKCAEARGKKKQTTEENDLEDGEIRDDDDFPVPARLREVFADVPEIRSAETMLTKAGNVLKEREASRAYKEAEATQVGEQKDRHLYSTVLFTAAKKHKDNRPSVVCKACGGAEGGCANCFERGWLTLGERTNGNG